MVILDLLPPDGLETLLRLIAATLLAGAIGFEREMRNKPAGLRTHMLVGLGSAAFSLYAFDLIRTLGEFDQTVSIDPSRVVSGVIEGLGFLGAGAIIQTRGDVHGLTTAAGIWIAGAIGVGCGMGSYFDVSVVTLITLICLVPIGKLEHALDTKGHQAKSKDEPIEVKHQD